MDMLKKLFPYSFGAKDIIALIIKIVVYLVASALVGWVCSLLGGIFIIGTVLGIVSWVFGIYCTVGWILAILAFLKVLK